MTVQIAYARRPLARRSTHAGLTALGPNEFEGYASLFGVPDGVGDTVAPGAFAASLRRRGPSQVRMLYQHFAHAPIGVWEEIAEDARGLYVRGRLVSEVERARDVRALLAEGALNGLSIGFRTVRARRGAANTRTLLEIDLCQRDARWRLRHSCRCCTAARRRRQRRRSRFCCRPCRPRPA